MGTGSGVAQDGEDGSFDRLANGVEGDLDSAGECIINGHEIEFVMIGDSFAQAAHDLGGDDAGIAACAHEGALGDRAATLFVGCADGKGRQVIDDHGKRQGHVGAGIAVGNREYVQAVDLIFTSGQRLGRSCDGVDDVVRRVIAHVFRLLLDDLDTASLVINGP